MIRGCRIKEVNNGYAVKGTVFSVKEDAEMFAYYLRIVLNNGKKLIYVNSEQEAITKHLDLHREHDDETWKNWLHICWKRNAGRYLHVEEGMYALNNIEDERI